MKKKVNQVLNIIMGSFTGVFIGSGIYKYWHFRKYPDLYAAYSAPWYTGILVNGLFTLALLVFCIMIKIILIENMELMKKAALISGIVFLVLAFTGGGYVLMNHGQVNAGYTVVPGIWAMICFGYYRSRKQN